jgi:hypothetical protein
MMAVGGGMVVAEEVVGATRVAEATMVAMEGMVVMTLNMAVVVMAVEMKALVAKDLGRVRFCRSDPQRHRGPGLEALLCRRHTRANEVCLALKERTAENDIPQANRTMSHSRMALVRSPVRNLPVNCLLTGSSVDKIALDWR